MPRKFIYVPQQCYAVITPETNKREIAGLCTDGLNVCSGVIVSANKNKYIFLCHADDKVNLFDPIDGLPSWIRRMQSMEGEARIQSIEIHYDDSDAATSGHYARNIHEIMRPFDRESCSIIIEAEPPMRALPGIAVFSDNGRVVRGGAIEFGLADGDYLVEEGAPVEKFSIENTPLRYFMSDIVKVEQEEQYPPICVFDATHMVTPRELVDRYSQVSAALSSNTDFLGEPSSSTDSIPLNP